MLLGSSVSYALPLFIKFPFFFIVWYTSKQTDTSPYLSHKKERKKIEFIIVTHNMILLVTQYVKIKCKRNQTYLYFFLSPCILISKWCSYTFISEHIFSENNCLEHHAFWKLMKKILGANPGYFPKKCWNPTIVQLLKQLSDLLALEP